MSYAYVDELHSLVNTKKFVLMINKAWEIIEPGTTKNQDKDDLEMGLIY